MNDNRIPATMVQAGLSYVLAGVFVAAAACNHSDPVFLLRATGACPPLPSAIVPWVAAWITPFEFVFGLFVAVPLYRRVAALGLAGLMALFLAVSINAQVTGLTSSSGFFGKFDPLLTRPALAVVRDLAVLASAISIYLVRFRNALAEMEATPPTIVSGKPNPFA